MDFHGRLLRHFNRNFLNGVCTYLVPFRTISYNFVPFGTISYHSVQFRYYLVTIWLLFRYYFVTIGYFVVTISSYLVTILSQFASRYLLPGTWYQVPGTRYLAWYLVPGTHIINTPPKVDLVKSGLRRRPPESP